MNDGIATQDTPDPLEDRLLDLLPRLRAHLGASRPRVPRAELDDVAQEVVARALSYRESFDPSRALWPWLRRVADRALLDLRSGAMRRPSLSAELEPPAPEETATLETREEVERLLKQLPPRECEVLQRFHQLGQSVRAIAAELGLPEGTVKSHLWRARRRLAGLDDERVT